MSDSEPATIEQHEYPNGLVLVAEAMPGVQSAAFTLLIPAGAAYEAADGVNVGGGAATMLAEWITRGAGARDSRELLTALDNLGVSHSESAQTLHTSMSAATLGRNLDPGAGDLRRHRAPPPPRRRGGRADPGPLPAEPAEPGGRPRHEGDLRAAAAALPRALGPALARDDRGRRRAHRRRTCGRSTGATYRPNGAILGVAGAIDWPLLKDAVGRLFGDWKPRPDPWLVEKPSGPAPRPHPPRDPADPDRPGPARRHGRQPRLLPRPGRRRRSSAATPRPGCSPRSARSAGSATRSTPATRASATARPCSATPGPRPTGPRRPSTSCSPSSTAWAASGDRAEELETMRAGPQELADHGPGIEHEPLRARWPRTGTSSAASARSTRSPPSSTP